MQSGGWQRLGRLVTAERIRLGYRSLPAFSAASGLSTSTLDSIEHGRKSSYDRATLAALERVLGWQHGSVDRVLHGLDPERNGDSDLTDIVDAWPRLSPGARAMLRRLAVEAARAERPEE